MTSAAEAAKTTREPIWFYAHHNISEQDSLDAAKDLSKRNQGTEVYVWQRSNALCNPRRVVKFVIEWGLDAVEPTIQKFAGAGATVDMPFKRVAETIAGIPTPQVPAESLQYKLLKKLGTKGMPPGIVFRGPY